MNENDLLVSRLASTAGLKTKKIKQNYNQDTIPTITLLFFFDRSDQHFGHGKTVLC